MNSPTQDVKERGSWIGARKLLKMRRPFFCGDGIDKTDGPGPRRMKQCEVLFHQEILDEGIWDYIKKNLLAKIGWGSLGLLEESISVRRGIGALGTRKYTEKYETGQSGPEG